MKGHSQIDMRHLPELSMQTTRRIFVCLGALLLLPSAFLYCYQQKFGFHPLIIVFGQAAILFAATLIGLVMLVLVRGRLPGGSRVSAWLLGVTFTLLLGAVVFVFTGATISNATWGDTLNYEITLTFAVHSSTLLDFLPLVPAQKKTLLIAAFAGAALLIVAVLVVAVKTASGLVAKLEEHFSSSPAGRGRMAVSFGTVAILAGGACLAIALVNPRSLYGEPISGFFKFVPASSLLHFDNMRLAAAIEDHTIRTTYRRPEEFNRKHVVVIFSDALRADRMGLYGYHRPTTPFLSQLYAAKKLHRVEMALSTCSESFCAIASTFASRPFHQISHHNFKLHNLLRDVGYRTNFFLAGDHRAWNYLFDFYGADIDVIHDHRTHLKDLHDDRPLLEALEQIEPANGRPQFFYFFLMSSHINGYKDPEFERYQPAHTDLMRTLTFWNELAGTRRTNAGFEKQRIGQRDIEAVSNRYDNGVLQTDAYLSRIFATLEVKGYLKDSIVVILGDHGEGLGEHGHIGHTRYLYQEDIRIPLLLYGGDAARYHNDAFAAQIDVAPTILEQLGLPIPSTWKGQSLSKPPGTRLTLHQTRRGRTPCFAAVERTDTSLMKYMRCGDAAQRTHEALFDLRADPGEQNNILANADVSRLERYRREIDGRFAVITNRCANFECLD
jgi:glucan phosphoethanolaminetransferase (alkaline phosphatase superfamily)